MKNLIGFKKIILLAGDVIILYFSLYFTLLIRYWQTPTPELWSSHFIPFSITFIFWIIIFFIAGLYNLHLAVNNANFFKLTSRSLSIAGLLSLAFFYLIPQISIAPKRNLLIYIIVFVILFYFWRRIYNGLLKSYLPKNTIAIIGLNNLAKELVQELKEKPHIGYNVAFVVDDKNSGLPAQAGIKNINNIPVFKGSVSLEKLIRGKNIDTIVLTSSPHQSSELRASLFNCLPLKINYINLPNFYESITGKIPIESIDKMWFLENLSEGSKRWFDIIKRIYDILLAFIIMLITIIFWPIIALLIKLESKGPVFFKQIRLGKNNQQFKVIKFRTMATVGNYFTPTIKDDIRITKIGSFLRKTRTDELPQLINILKGEMSFVGPRPERPELIRDLEKKIPFYHERMLVKPGATGWDQISGEYHSPSYEDSLKKLQYDLFYIKNRSIYLDLSIILKTIATVLSRGGR
jgi:exopolysaccharide biosynthesis polyprenyl glycosylphosphotransferase